MKTIGIGRLVLKTRQCDPVTLGRSNFRYIDISSIDRQSKRIIDAPTMCTKNAPSRARKLISAGDVLVSTVRPNLNAVALVTKQYDSEIASTGFCVLRPDKEQLESAYLYYFVQTDHFINRLVHRATGAGYPAVSDGDILESEIPVPSLHEQKRIAAVLDKADRLRRTRRFAQDLGNRFLQSVFLVMFGDPVTNPMRWTVAELGTLLKNIDSGWSPNCEDARTSSDQWAVLRLSAVTYGMYKPEENKRLPPRECPRPELEVKRGDVLFTRKNTYDLVGACALVHVTPPRLMLPDTIFRFNINPQSDLISAFLFGLLNNKAYKRRVQQLASGTAGSMPNISKEKLMELRLPLPPRTAQNRFALLVAGYERIRRQQVEAERQAEHLFQALLHRAFSQCA